MATGLLITPLAYVADLTFWQNHNPAYLIWALVMIFISTLADGRTVGKRWAKLHVSGQGCLVCRELRRIGPFVIAGLFALTEGFLPGAAVSASPFIVLALVAIAYAVPLVRGAADFPHNIATGLAVRSVD